MTGLLLDVASLAVASQGVKNTQKDKSSARKAKKAKMFESDQAFQQQNGATNTQLSAGELALRCMYHDDCTIARLMLFARSVTSLVRHRFCFAKTAQHIFTPLDIILHNARLRSDYCSTDCIQQQGSSCLRFRSPTQLETARARMHASINLPGWTGRSRLCPAMCMHLQRLSGQSRRNHAQPGQAWV